MLIFLIETSLPSSILQLGSKEWFIYIPYGSNICLFVPISIDYLQGVSFISPVNIKTVSFSSNSFNENNASPLTLLQKRTSIYLLFLYKTIYFYIFLYSNKKDFKYLFSI